ncbi:MAG: helix-turn-helix transcriptional regulator [Verrucomicrobia bacterium]|nr:helix-turn-helix transcriptional regulator [Verrucomicrobiota bacterium]
MQPIPSARAALAANIQRWMDLRGLTQEHLAARSGLGKNTIHDILAQHESPRHETLVLIARALDVGLRELTGSDAEQVRKWVPELPEDYREEDFAHSRKFQEHQREEHHAH